MAHEAHRPIRPCEVCNEPFAAHPKVRTCSRACGVVLRGRTRAAAFDRDRRSGKLKGRYTDKSGYVRVLLSPTERETFTCYATGWALEHRFKMEQKLGRRLLPTETVHHKNGRRDDNRLRNLELRVGRHGNGATHKHCDTCTCFD